MAVQDTSLETYFKGRDSFDSQRDLIYDFILKNPNKTQAPARVEFGLDPNTVSARYNDLMKLKLIIKTGQEHEPLCGGRKMYTWKAVDNVNDSPGLFDDIDEYPFDDPKYDADRHTSPSSIPTEYDENGIVRQVA